MASKLRHTLSACLILAVAASSCSTASHKAKNCSEVQKEDFILVTQKNGPELGYSGKSGVSIISKGGHLFKDHNRNGKLDAYEDWRLSPEKRAKALTKDLSIEEIAGLMQCSHMQALPGTNANHYGGKNFRKSGAKASDLTDEQKVFLDKDKVKSVLLAGAESKQTICKWVNNIQNYVEGMDHGIPVAILSDPRNGASSDMEFYAGSGGDISRWPEALATAATFDPEVAREFGEVASAEYRALGISTALSPQADLPGEPRWWRTDGTFGENPELTADMVRAYCDGFQTSSREQSIRGAWGYGSVNTMVKHWYGYGAQEGGREAHFANGEYGVFPSDNLEAFRMPFVEGAFKLENGTGCTAAVMTNYSILWNQDPSGENVACSYSKYLIQQKLREESGFDGVVCTDWDVTFNCSSMFPETGIGRGKPWGVEGLSFAERHLRILLAGVDQFGGENDIEPVLAGYRLWAEQFGEESARRRFEESAYRILLTMFRTGIFENPFDDIEKVEEVVGCSDFMERGYQAQLKSVVMLKNKGVLPVCEKASVYVPKRHFPAVPGIWGGVSAEKVDYPVDIEMVRKSFNVVDTPQEADFALVFIEGPAVTLGYSAEDLAAGGNGYVPISLQYEDYTAETSKEVTIAGGNPLEKGTNRSFKGKSVKTYNRDDMVLVQETKAAMGEKPVVVAVDMKRATVLSEIEPWCDALLVLFSVQKQTALDIVRGAFEPSGLLPLQMPANMLTVEAQKEDLTLDMECYQDSEGNVYDYAFGMNWGGVINDARVQRYSVRK